MSKELDGIKDKVWDIIKILKEKKIINDTIAETTAYNALYEFEMAKHLETEKGNEAQYNAWMFHWKHGAKLFRNITDSYIKELMDAGWVDNPKKAIKPPEKETVKPPEKEKESKK